MIWFYASCICWFFPLWLKIFKGSGETNMKLYSLPLHYLQSCEKGRYKQQTHKQTVKCYKGFTRGIKKVNTNKFACWWWEKITEKLMTQWSGSLAFKLCIAPSHTDSELALSTSKLLCWGSNSVWGPRIDHKRYSYFFFFFLNHLL